MEILSIVFPVFFIIAVGYALASIKKLDFEPVMEILLYITIPALVISSLSKKKFIPAELGLVTIVVVAVVAGTWLLTLLYIKAAGRGAASENRGLYISTMFMNSGNMGFPLALLAFGIDGLAVAVLYYIAVTVLVSTLGIYTAKGSGGFSEVFKTPLIYAALIALAVSYSGVALPGTVQVTLDMLGAPTIPLMQLALGYRLYTAKASMLPTSIAASVIRIGGGVLIAWGLTTLLGMEGTIRAVVILSSSMPSAVINLVMSEKYNADPELVASVVAVSTFMSLGAAPLVLMWVM